MIRVFVDFNCMERAGAVVVRPKDIPIEELKVGNRITVYTPGEMECEAILRHGQMWEWVADMVEGTTKSLEDE